MIVAYLRAQQYNEQFTADGQIGHCEQMGSSQLKLDTLSQMTLNNADDSKETTATSDIESRPWEQVGSPQLKLDTRSTSALKDVTETPKNPMISDELSQLQEQMMALQLESDTISKTTPYDANIKEETSITLYQ